MKELIGKTVKRIFIRDDDEILAFETDAGIIAYLTDGECCSKTWFESITGVEALIGNVVTAQESIDMPEPPRRDYKSNHECDDLQQDYGQKLTTAKGIVDIVYRNASNGYYGGDIRLIDAPDISAFKEITDDWTAA